MAYRKAARLTLHARMHRWLVRSRFIEEKVAVLIAGSYGSGKIHLAQALGHAAVLQERDVLCTAQSHLIVSLRGAAMSPLEGWQSSQE